MVCQARQWQRQHQASRRGQWIALADGQARPPVYCRLAALPLLTSPPLPPRARSVTREHFAAFMDVCGHALQRLHTPAPAPPSRAGSAHGSPMHRRSTSSGLQQPAPGAWPQASFSSSRPGSWSAAASSSAAGFAAGGSPARASTAPAGAHLIAGYSSPSPSSPAASAAGTPSYSRPAASAAGTPSYSAASAAGNPFASRPPLPQPGWLVGGPAASAAAQQPLHASHGGLRVMPASAPPPEV
jgi:hypothetical protein